MKTQAARRQFLLQTGGAAAAAWLNAQWPVIAAAAQHAHEKAKSGAVHFEVLTPAQARDLEAIASQIIPTDDLPGAREAGVVYFVDRALKTFAADSLAMYQKGLKDVNELVASKYPGVKTFADASADQQQAVMAELAEHLNPGGGRRNPFVSGDFVQTIWQHTVLGFLADPEAGGNREYAGWKVIDRDPAHSFSPPFGFYDKDYPGWEAASAQTEQK